jgi:hypothetical protein
MNDGKWKWKLDIEMIFNAQFVGVIYRAGNEGANSTEK